MGLEKGGAFVWESGETSQEKAWQRIPKKYRQQIIDNEINVYLLNGFAIAAEATDREDLQTRMQGNSFLGSFFRVSTFLDDYKVDPEEFKRIVLEQYQKKFGRFGENVVASNMKVMQAGFDNVIKLAYGDVDAPDTSAFIGSLIHPCGLSPMTTTGQESKAPLFTMETFDQEYRSGMGYDQPSSPLASVGVMAAGTGATSSKYVARRQIPIYLAENCTQCMDCMVACPDSAMPSTAQDISTVLRTAINNYVNDDNSRSALLEAVPALDQGCRSRMRELVDIKEDKTPFKEVLEEQINALSDDNVSDQAKSELMRIVSVLPLAFQNTRSVFKNMEKKEEGAGGLFSIFINDLCKGCAACVDACGKHEALVMAPETEEMNADYHSATEFLKLLGDTPTKYLGLLNLETPQDTKAAALKNHLMVQSKYNAFASGDGACAGCGEKGILRSVATLTETLMRPAWDIKSNRLEEKVAKVKRIGVDVLNNLETNQPESYQLLRRAMLHTLLGLGGVNDQDTDHNIDRQFDGDNEDLIHSLVKVLEVDIDKHRNHTTITDSANGMSVMAMAAHTGCNTVYGSTPPNNPHPYPWMNSLFQDGATIGWIIGESFMKDHARQSVVPERLTDLIISGFHSENGTEVKFTEQDYFDFTHLSDTQMTDLEISELPKVWIVGGDGGMGDIGFQNVSKAVLQNRPNVNMLMMDTQVYSNTGGQNSDSSPMTGGFDMNQAGQGSEGKLTEKKSVAESFLGGHGSPFVAQVSAANVGTLYKAILDGISYRGTSFFQVFTTCQPEHGVPDYAAQIQALKIRDSRGMPEFVFNPQLGETYQECLNIKGNTAYNKDWVTKMAPVTREKFLYLVPNWAFTENRFRFHHKKVKEDDIKGKIPLEAKIQLVLMDDVVNRRYLNKDHRSYIPDFGVYIADYGDNGSKVYHLLSRQMVLFCVERRKSWRILQSRAGVENSDYQQQKELLAQIDGGELTVEKFMEGWQN
jgi:pyruvate-ferredoxin/flavodoxin oxidoreductase